MMCCSIRPDSTTSKTSPVNGGPGSGPGKVVRGKSNQVCLCSSVQSTALANRDLFSQVGVSKQDYLKPPLWATTFVGLGIPRSLWVMRSAARLEGISAVTMQAKRSLKGVEDEPVTTGKSERAQRTILQFVLETFLWRWKSFT